MQQDEVKKNEEQEEKVTVENNNNVQSTENNKIQNDENQLSNEITSKDLSFELNEQKDKYLRLFAEFDNYKKRSAKEKRDLALVAGQDIIKELVTVIDDYKRANKSFMQDNNKESYADGLHLIFDKFIKILSAKGLKEMESIGADFDFEKHEAIAEVPAPTEQQKGKIIDEVETGYLLNNTIIRYAKVVVGK